MNISQLKYAVEIEKAGSITQAAENLFMGQPNLSKAIKELETELGITIFKRTSTGVAITSAGREFLLYAKSILSKINEIEEIYIKKSKNTAAFSLCAAQADYVYQAFLRLARNIESDEMDIKFKETDSVTAAKAVADGEFNMGIIRWEKKYRSNFLSYFEDKNLGYEEIWDFERLAVMSENHPLANCENLDKAMLSDYIQVMRGDLSVPFMSVAESRIERTAQSKKKIYMFERSSRYNLLSMSKNAYTLSPPVTEATLKKYGLIQRKVAGSHSSDVFIYRKDYIKSDLDLEYINYLENIIEGLGEKL